MNIKHGSKQRLTERVDAISEWCCELRDNVKKLTSERNGSTNEE